jgi:hypothetical protein
MPESSFFIAKFWNILRIPIFFSSLCRTAAGSGLTPDGGRLAWPLRGRSCPRPTDWPSRGPRSWPGTPSVWRGCLWPRPPSPPHLRPWDWSLLYIKNAQNTFTFLQRLGSTAGLQTVSKGWNHLSPPPPHQGQQLWSILLASWLT